MTREEAVAFLKTKPAKYAKMLGFTKLGSLHNKWIIDMVTGKGDKTLQGSRGTYKTTCVSVALALIIILLPNKKTAFFRKTDGDVKEIIRQVQKILKDPHTLYFVQCIYGVNLQLTTENATEVNTNLSKDTKGTMQLTGIGLGTSITGKHFDLIFTDDIVNIKDRISRAERENTKLMYQELVNLRNRGGRLFNTGTPWHPDDAFSIMPPAEKYDCYNEDIRKIIKEDELEEIKSKLTRSLFAVNYELKFVADDDVIFPDAQTGADDSLAFQGVAHVDAAFYGEDYTALTIMGIHEGKFYVFGKCWRKHVDDVMDEIVMWYEKFTAGKLYIELNADKGYVAKQLKKRGIRVATYNENQNKHVKIVSYLKFEWKNVIFVAGTDEQYINQICDYNENAEHDDCPDSLASLIRAEGRKLNRPEAEAERKSIFY